MSERKYRHPQVNLRLPEELKEKIAEIAASNGRSSNSEMVAAIESWVRSRGVPPKKILDELRQRLDTIESKIEKQKELMLMDESNKKPT